jgi:hypothetical protein
MVARWLPVLVVALSAGCGGGGGGGAAAPAAVNPPAPAEQSAGGMWFSVAGTSSGMSLMIAETGDLRVVMPPSGSSGPAFGFGAVTVAGNRVEGSLKTRAITPSPGSPAGPELDCTVTGTVSTRASMQLTTVCVDKAGTSTTTAISMMYDPRYDADSSLPDIAGNYTLAPPASSSTNTLNINGDGTVFGLYNNGPRCTLNGTVSIINGDFNLYRFEALFSNCTVLASTYEGASMAGFATRNVPGHKTGAFHVMLTAVINGRLEFVSVIYEPV